MKIIIQARDKKSVLDFISDKGNTADKGANYILSLCNASKTIMLKCHAYNTSVRKHLV